MLVDLYCDMTLTSSSSDGAARPLGNKLALVMHQIGQTSNNHRLWAGFVPLLETVFSLHITVMPPTSPAGAVVGKTLSRSPWLAM